MGKVRELAEDLWSGKVTTDTVNPVTAFLGLEELGDNLAFVGSLANVSAFRTDEGMVWIDTGGLLAAAGTVSTIRTWCDARVHTAVYTHGHVDHVFGAPELDRVAGEQGWDRPHIIAHRALPARFDRYRLTAGYNAAINARQFRVPGLRWPTEYRYPDQLFDDELKLEIGGLEIELRHDRGETDDHVWAWLPGPRVLCTGDLFIWAAPNCGNPQKAQRYPSEWARALDKMAELGAETLLPGHGPPIFGADRVEQALRETAELLHLVHDRTVELMNEGLRLDDVVRQVVIPPRLLERPYLRPVYDQPTFVVRNIWRLYGGWYDGNPAHLEPPPDRALAGEVAGLAGGAKALAQRARQLAEEGDLAAACQLAEWSRDAAPDDAEVAAIRSEIFRQRAAGASSLMARSIYLAAADESVS